MCTLNRAVPTRNPNHILRPGRVRLLAPGSRECVHALTGSSSNLLPLPFICSQTYSFMNFFHYIPSSPISWTVFSKLLFNTSLIPEAVPAHPGTSPMVVLQGYTGCLGDGQMPVHEAKLWFRRVDPFLSVTLSKLPAFVPHLHQNLSSWKADARIFVSVLSRAESARDIVGAQRK